MRLKALLCSACACCVSAACAAAQPNFVVIMFDDAGYTDLGFTGSDLVPTPAIDSVARDGVTFTDGYVTASVCSPSRAGFLTGRYQQRYGHEFNLNASQEENSLGLPSDATTIPELLKGAGYRTGLIGKWHLGMREGLRPTDQGFDEFQGLWAGSRTYFAEQDATDRHALRDGGERIDEPDGLYLTRWIGERAVEFIESADASPYFLFVSYTSPHTPMHALDEDLVAVSGIEGVTDRRRTYAAMLRSLDRSVGDVLQAIEASGQGDRTAVFVVNDNGGATNNGSDNGPYRGMKGSKWEGGLRVPFALRWEGVVRPGTSFSHPISTLDIGSTMVAAAGATPGPSEPLDGVDLAPFLRGERGGPPHEMLFWRRGVAAAVRHGPWKLIRSEGNPTLLFDLLADPSERRDLAGSHPDVVRDLIGILEDWEAELAPPGWEEGQKWQRNQVRKHQLEVESREQERRWP